MCTRIKQLRVNEQIRSQRIKLVKEGEGIVEVPFQEALDIAIESGLDLVEVDGTVMPPICKVMDYGKFIYKQRKSEQKAKKEHKPVETKEVRIGFATGEHDLLVKENQVRRFIEKKNPVRLTLLLKGREMSHMGIAEKKLISFSERFEELGTLERESKKQANKLSILLSPFKK